VELAQTARTWNDALWYNKKQFAEQKTNLALLTTAKKALLDAHVQLEETCKKQELNLLKVIKDQKEALPKLATAKKLDTLIAEKEKQKSVAQSEVDLAKIKQEKHRKQVDEKEIESAKFAAEIKTIQEWQTKYDPKKPIAENKDLIVSKLIDAEKWLGSLQSTKAEKERLDENISASNAEIDIKTLDFEQVKVDWELFQKKYDEKSTAVLLIPIEQLTLDKDATDWLINKTIEAQSMWNVLNTLQHDFEALRQKQAKDQEAVLQKDKHLKQLKVEVERNFIAKETSEKLVQKARLSATESVESLRAGLVNNEPCLVCGSEEHPYILHNPQLEKVLTALEELHQNNEKLYLISFGENSRLEQEIKNLNELIVKQETEIDSKKEGVELKNKEWKNTLIAKDIELISREEKATWLEAKIKELKTRQAKFQEQIKAHLDQKNHLEKDKIQLDIQTERKIKCSDELKELKSQRSINTEKWEGFNKEILQTEKTLAEIKNGISSFFVVSDWMEKWTEKPKEFVTSIVNFSKEWKTNIEKLDDHQNQQSLTSATLIQLKNQAKSLDEELALKLLHFDALSSDFDAKNVERKLIFEGKSAELLELQFASAVEEAQKNAQVIQKNLQQNEVSTAASEAQNKEIIVNISKFELEIKRTNEILQTWLNEHNQKFKQSLTLLELNELLGFTSEWIDNERKVMNDLAEEKTKTTSILLERRLIFDEHLAKKPSERLLEELKLLFENTKTQNEIFTQSKATLAFKRAQDLENKDKMGDLVREISAQSEISDHWSKINDIIGSADGRKFRQIAQEYTLEVLLSYANLHLQDLTARYKIERIPNTLGLQVVDQDMGDEIRTVYSLSGGESFLVSLALALGLASLSSSKMKVESLFIDEGFGSLDPNTLNVAMDALERLHNLGRKVGVISHVQEMTERIPVQIKVSKKASGRSLVEIVGI
jgi:exonuclease SbcC